MSAFIGDHGAVMRCLVKGHSMGIGNDLVELAMDNEYRSLIGADSCKIIKRVSDQKRGRKVSFCK